MIMFWISSLSAINLILSYTSADVLYTYYNISKDYGEAESKCIDDGKVLVNPTNEMEYQELISYLTKTDIQKTWIGQRNGNISKLSDNYFDGSGHNGPMGRHGDTSTPISMSGETNQPTDTCFVATRSLSNVSWLMDIQSCDEKNSFICQEEKTEEIVETETACDVESDGIPVRHSGVNYIFQPGLTPEGICLQSTIVTSLIECGVKCNKFDKCNIIQMKDGGECDLYSTSSSILKSDAETKGKTYLLD